MLTPDLQNAYLALLVQLQQIQRNDPQLYAEGNMGASQAQLQSALNTETPLDPDFAASLGDIVRRYQALVAVRDFRSSSPTARPDPSSSVPAFEEKAPALRTYSFVRLATIQEGTYYNVGDLVALYSPTNQRLSFYSLSDSIQIRRDVTYQAQPVFSLKKPEHGRQFIFDEDFDGPKKLVKNQLQAFVVELKPTYPGQDPFEGAVARFPLTPGFTYVTGVPYEYNYPLLRQPQKSKDGPSVYQAGPFLLENHQPFLLIEPVGADRRYDFFQRLQASSPPYPVVAFWDYSHGEYRPTFDFENPAQENPGLIRASHLGERVAGEIRVVPNPLFSEARAAGEESSAFPDMKGGVLRIRPSDDVVAYLGLSPQAPLSDPFFLGQSLISQSSRLAASRDSGSSLKPPQTRDEFLDYVHHKKPGVFYIGKEPFILLVPHSAQLVRGDCDFALLTVRGDQLVYDFYNTSQESDIFLYEKICSACKAGWGSVLSGVTIQTKEQFQHIVWTETGKKVPPMDYVVKFSPMKWNEDFNAMGLAPIRNTFRDGFLNLESAKGQPQLGVPSSHFFDLTTSSASRLPQTPLEFTDYVSSRKPGSFCYGNLNFICFNLQPNQDFGLMVLINNQLYFVPIDDSVKDKARFIEGLKNPKKYFGSDPSALQSVDMTLERSGMYYSLSFYGASSSVVRVSAYPLASRYTVLPGRVVLSMHDHCLIRQGESGPMGRYILPQVSNAGGTSLKSEVSQPLKEVTVAAFNALKGNEPGVLDLYFDDSLRMPRPVRVLVFQCDTDPHSIALVVKAPRPKAADHPEITTGLIIRAFNNDLFIQEVLDAIKAGKHQVTLSPAAGKPLSECMLGIPKMEWSFIAPEVIKKSKNITVKGTHIRFENEVGGEKRIFDFSLIDTPPLHLRPEWLLAPVSASQHLQVGRQVVFESPLDKAYKTQQRIEKKVKIAVTQDSPVSYPAEALYSTSNPDYQFQLPALLAEGAEVKVVYQGNPYSYILGTPKEGSSDYVLLEGEEEVGVFSLVRNQVSLKIGDSFSLQGALPLYTPIQSITLSGKTEVELSALLYRLSRRMEGEDAESLRRLAGLSYAGRAVVLALGSYKADISFTHGSWNLTVARQEDTPDEVFIDFIEAATEAEMDLDVTGSYVLKLGAQGGEALKLSGPYPFVRLRETPEGTYYNVGAFVAFYSNNESILSFYSLEDSIKIRAGSTDDFVPILFFMKEGKSFAQMVPPAHLYSPSHALTPLSGLEINLALTYPGQDLFAGATVSFPAEADPITLGLVKPTQPVSIPDSVSPSSASLAIPKTVEEFKELPPDGAGVFFINGKKFLLVESDPDVGPGFFTLNHTGELVMGMHKKGEELDAVIKHIKNVQSEGGVVRFSSAKYDFYSNPVKQPERNYYPIRCDFMLGQTGHAFDIFFVVLSATGFNYEQSRCFFEGDELFIINNLSPEKRHQLRRPSLLASQDQSSSQMEGAPISRLDSALLTSSEVADKKMKFADLQQADPVAEALEALPIDKKDNALIHIEARHKREVVKSSEAYSLEDPDYKITLPADMKPGQSLVIFYKGKPYTYYLGKQLSRGRGFELKEGQDVVGSVALDSDKLDLKIGDHFSIAGSLPTFGFVDSLTLSCGSDDALHLLLDCVAARIDRSPEMKGQGDYLRHLAQLRALDPPAIAALKIYNATISFSRGSWHLTVARNQETVDDVFIDFIEAAAETNAILKDRATRSQPVVPISEEAADLKADPYILKTLQHVFPDGSSVNVNLKSRGVDAEAYLDLDWNKTSHTERWEWFNGVKPRSEYLIHLKNSVSSTSEDPSLKISRAYSFKVSRVYDKEAIDTMGPQDELPDVTSASSAKGLRGAYRYHLSGYYIETRTYILSDGDRVEVTLKVEEGEQFVIQSARWFNDAGESGLLTYPSGTLSWNTPLELEWQGRPKTYLEKRIYSAQFSLQANASEVSTNLVNTSSLPLAIEKGEMRLVWQKKEERVVISSVDYIAGDQVTHLISQPFSISPGTDSWSHSCNVSTHIDGFGIIESPVELHFSEGAFSAVSHLQSGSFEELTWMGVPIPGGYLFKAIAWKGQGRLSSYVLPRNGLKEGESLRISIHDGDKKTDYRLCWQNGAMIVKKLIVPIVPHDFKALTESRRLNIPQSPLEKPGRPFMLPVEIERASFVSGSELYSLLHSLSSQEILYPTLESMERMMAVAAQAHAPLQAGDVLSSEARTIRIQLVGSRSSLLFEGEFTYNPDPEAPLRWRPAGTENQ